MASVPNVRLKIDTDPPEIGLRLSDEDIDKIARRVVDVLVAEILAPSDTPAAGTPPVAEGQEGTLRY